MYERLDEPHSRAVAWGKIASVLFLRGEYMVVGQLRSEIEAQIPQRDADVAALEAELVSVRAEQKRLAKAVALADDVPELVTELQQRFAGIQNLEGQLIAAKRTPAELAALVDRVEANVRANVAALRQALADQSDLRDVFLALFPHGLTFEPARTPDGSRQIWKISGEADFAQTTGPAEPSRFRMDRDPNGAAAIRNRSIRISLNFLALHPTTQPRTDSSTALD